VVSLLEDKRLDRDYMEWRAKEISANRIQKPPAPSYDPQKFTVPFLSESNRRTLGQPLQELEEELLQFKSVRASGGPIDTNRLTAVHREVGRLHQQKLDIAWSLKQQSDYDKFIRRPQVMGGVNEGKSFTKRVGGLGGRILKNRKLLAGGVAAALVLGYMFSSRDKTYNTIEGLHPGSQGMGAESLRAHSEFGSGYQGLPSSLMGQDIDPRILGFRTDVMDDPKAQAALRAELREAQAEVQYGKLGKEDLGARVASSILNPRNRNLRKVDLSNFNLSIEDADSLLLERKRGAGDPIAVRLSGIDAPEVAGHADDPLAAVRIDQAQPYGEEASDILRNLVDQQDNLSLVIDPSQKTYGRYLGALVGDDSVLNEELVRQGAVSALPFGPRSKDIINRDISAQIEAEAQHEGRGMWQLARYKASAVAEENTGQAITYNTLSRIDKLSQNLNLGAFQSFLESFGDEGRELTAEEMDTAQRMGYVLRKTHGPRKRKYNKSDGMHPGSEGMGAQSVRKHSDFGSGFISPIMVAYKQKASEEGWAYYKGYKSPERIGAEKYIDTLGSKKRNLLEGLHPGSEGMGAQSIRKHSDFGSGFKKPQVALEVLKGLRSKVKKSFGTIESNLNVIIVDRIEDVAKHPGKDVVFGGKNPSVLAQIQRDLNKSTPSTKETAFQNFMVHPHELMESEFVRSIGVNNKLKATNPEKYLEAVGKLGDSAFGTHFSEKVIEGEAVMAWGMGPEAFAAIRKFRGLEGKGLMKDFYGGKRLMRNAEKRGLDLGENVQEAMADSGKEIHDYVLRTNKIYKKAEKVAPKRLKQAGIERLSITPEELIEQTPWVGESIAIEHLIARGHTPRFSEYLAKNPTAIKHKGTYNEIPGMHPGSEGLGAQSIRQHSEFQAKWDMARKIAKEIYHESADDVAFKQFTQSKLFKEAIQAGLKGPSKKLGQGGQGQVWAYTAQIRAQVGKETKEFSLPFAVKSALPAKTGFTPIQATPHIKTRASEIDDVFLGGLHSEAESLKALGADGAPSFYGHGKDFGLKEEAIFMEKFELGANVKDIPLSIKEVKEAERIAKSAHKRGITHTDMSNNNIVRAINPQTGAKEVGVLDWGMANRLEKVGEIGGIQPSEIFHGWPVLQRKLEKATGRPVGAQEFSEVADILQIRARGPGQARRSSKNVMESMYDYNNAVEKVRVLDQQLIGLERDPNARKALFENTAEALDKSSKQLERDELFLGDVADDVASYITGKHMKAPVPITAPILSAAKGSLETGTAVINKIRHRAQKSQVIATADTQLAAYNKPVSKGRSAVISVQRRAKSAIIKRNKRFHEVSERSVGVGLRASASATKGHHGFSSTGSTTVL